MTTETEAMELWQKALEAYESAAQDEYGYDEIYADADPVAASIIAAALKERDARIERLWTPPEEAWSGLARDLMMALDMKARTPREIFQHIERTGKSIPQWLRDEPEMKQLDHVPSKGTRAVIIYRAMLEATLKALEADHG